MDKPVADAIIAAADAIGLEMSIRESYSGRGMYGKDTVAVIYEDTNDLLKAVATAVIDLKDAEEYVTHRQEQGEEVDDVALRAEDFVEELGGFRYDNMGRDSLIVY